MIARLIIKEPPQRGTLRGECCVCGEMTTEGVVSRFSSNFTGYSYLTHGDCFCPYCYEFFRTQDFRRRSWVATEKGVKFLTRKDCREVILSPPEPPFYIYITETGQRQGWLQAMKQISYSRERFFIITDFVGFFLAERKKAERMDALIKELREKNISKTAIRTGNYTIHQYRILMDRDAQHLIEQAKKHVKDPLWEVMVYVAD